MARRKKDNRPRCRGCAQPFTPTVSQEFCTLCDADREQAAAKLNELRDRLMLEREEVPAPVADALREERDRLQARIENLESELSFKDVELAAARLQTSLRDTANGFQPAATIPADVLASLVRLAHPDKHGGSEAANKATAWLLQQRKRAGANQ